MDLFPKRGTHIGILSLLHDGVERDVRHHAVLAALDAEALVNCLHLGLENRDRRRHPRHVDADALQVLVAKQDLRLGCCR